MASCQSNEHTPRSKCAAALLPNNKLMVVGGISSTDDQSNEVATIHEY